MKKIFIYIFAGLLLASCDDFLDEDNLNSPTVQFNSLAETDGVLNATYNSLFNQFVLMIPEEALRSDVAISPQRVGNRIVRTSVFNNLAYNSSTLETTRKWTALYRGINLANQVLFGLEQIEGSIRTEEERDQFVQQQAQARFFRGLYHFFLRWTYNNGNVILGDQFVNNLKLSNRPLSDAATVTSFYEQDLQFAFDNLPFESTITEKGRASRGAAGAFLGQSFLYQERWSEAAVIFEELIDPSSEHGYRLVTEENLLFTTDGEFNAESIFEIAYTDEFNNELSSFNTERLTNRLGRVSSLSEFAGQPDFLPAAWLINAYRNEEIDFNDRTINDITNGEGNPAQRSISLRGTTMLSFIEDLNTEFYLSPNFLQATINQAARNPNNSGPGINGAIFKKYANFDFARSEDQLGSNSNDQSAKNVTIMRLAEVHLMLAECYLEMGRTQDALGQINVIRNRWGLLKRGPVANIPGIGVLDASSYDEINYSNDEVMNLLRSFEKPLELSAEGHATRFIDLRRWGLLATRFKDLSEQNYIFTAFGQSNTALTRGNRTASNRSRIIGGEASIVGAKNNLSRGSVDVPTVDLFLADVEISVDGETVTATPNDKSTPLKEFSGVTFSPAAAFYPIPLEEQNNNNSL